MVDPINSALEAAHKKISQLLSERSKIDKEIVSWKRVVDSLLAVSESDGSDPSDVEVSAFVKNERGVKTIKFTDSVRMVLQQHSSRDIPISVPEIRDQLINLGFNFAKYAQPLVPIHNTLKRLEEQGEVCPLKNEQGQVLGYKWISPIERALEETLNWSGLTNTFDALCDAGLLTPAEIEQRNKLRKQREEKLVQWELNKKVEEASARRRGRQKS